MGGRSAIDSGVSRTAIKDRYAFGSAVACRGSKAYSLVSLLAPADALGLRCTGQAK